MDNKDIIISKQEQKIAEQEQKITAQQQQIDTLTSTVEELQEVIRELRRQLNQDSHNSSQPPSKDGFKKVRVESLRKKSGKKVGGQKGHKGNHMELPHDPDNVKAHYPEKCQTCPHLAQCLATGSVFKCREKRYEVNAVITTKVTEHQSMTVCNCLCGEQNLIGSFPENVKAYIQYGDSVTVLAGLLNTYGAVSAKRIQVLLGTILGVRLSTGTICSMVEKCAAQVGDTLKVIQQKLRESSVVHFDETGVNVNGKNMWVHSASTSTLTYQTFSEKRGQAGINEGGILPDYTGIAVHDCWSSYWKYDAATHAVCNAHLLRELTGVEQYSPDHKWATRFKALLLAMKKAKETTIARNKQQISPDFWHKCNKEYDQILALAEEECPLPAAPRQKKKGRPKKGKERALIERLQKLKGEVCFFIRDFRVPFDNNQAERDVRNVKTKSKVSGCFRTHKGTQHYLDIMSFLSTGLKHGVNVFKALTSAFTGNASVVLQ